MKEVWVEHDGKAGPLPGTIHKLDGAGQAVLQTRGDLNDQPGRPPYRWKWAGRTHLPQDVMRYAVLVHDETPCEDSIPAASRPAAPAGAIAGRAAVLDAARVAVLKDRAATHGALENSFGQLARVWSVRLGLTISPAQVALMLVDLKVTRAFGNPGHADNWVDIAGYAACGGELAGAVTDGGAA
jgi:hypothetical protein